MAWKHMRGPVCSIAWIPSLHLPLETDLCRRCERQSRGFTAVSAQIFRERDGRASWGKEGHLRRFQPQTSRETVR